VVLETVDWINSRYSLIFIVFNVFSVAVFTVEYILRVWSCTEDPKFKDPVGGRLRFMITPLAIIDLMAFLPFYLPFALPELRFLRAFRLFRLFRVLKLARYSESLQTFADVLKLKKEELGLMLFAIIILLTVSSSLMYEAEHEAQPEAFSSIPAAMWWGVVTLATVGYGDMFPITPMGKFIGSLVVLLGIGLFALPTGVLAAGFSEVLQRKREAKQMKDRICPHCGKRVDEAQMEDVCSLREGKETK
jgi:voltage-gated potassium channel